MRSANRGHWATLHLGKTENWYFKSILKISFVAKNISLNQYLAWGVSWDYFVRAHFPVASFSQPVSVLVSNQTMTSWSFCDTDKKLIKSKNLIIFDETNFVRMLLPKFYLLAAFTFSSASAASGESNHGHSPWKEITRWNFWRVGFVGYR